MPHRFDANKILKLIKSRRSIRSYSSKKIKDEELKMILEAARWAPSAHNNQPWRFVIITDKKIKSQLIGNIGMAAVFNRHLISAPLVIIVYTEDTNNRWVEVDCGLASQNIMLMAWALGIGSCFNGAFDESLVKKVLNFPEKAKIIGLISLGFPASRPKPPPRLELNQIITTNRQIQTKKTLNKIINPKKGLLSLFLNKILKSQHPD